MSICKTFKSLAVALLALAVPATAVLAAADPEHPDWPCVQKRVENLSLMAIWDGPPVEEYKDWYRDEALSKLVTKLAARRVAIEKAKAAVDEFAKGLPADKRDQQLSALFFGLFTTVNTQRRGIISGVEKYQRAQKARAAELEQQGVDLAKLKGDIVVDDTAAEPLSPEEEKLYWAGRIFQERQGNISIACELPAAIEERLFELTRHIRGLMSK